MSSDCSTPSQSSRITITRAIFPADAPTIHALFASYASNPSLYASLNHQNFSHELATLPGAYAPPLGAVLLARDDHTGAAVGCIAIRPLPWPLLEPCQAEFSKSTAAKSCELKRLYSLPTHRGLGIGRRLVERALKEAERLGYQEVKLDTLPWMKEAVGLYMQMGFEKVEAYHEPGTEGLVFLGRRLDGE